MKLIYKGIMLGCIVMQWGCSNYVYSPSVLPSPKPLEKGAVDVKGGIGLFPKVKPDVPYTTQAGVLDIGYGFTDKFSLYGNAWSDLSTQTFFYKAGISLSTRVSLWHNDQAEVILYPRAAVLKNGGAFDAIGFELSGLYLRKLPKDFYAYAGVAGFGGNREIAKHSYDNEALYGVLGHVGVGYETSSYFRIMVELNPIYQYNKYFEKGNFVLSPTFAIGYLIGMSPNDASKFKEQRRK